MNCTRRTFLVMLAASSASIGRAAHAQAALDEKDPEARAKGYVADAGKADGKKYPTYVAGQNCASCALFQGKPGDALGACPVFGGKRVPAGAWCSSWAPMI